MASIVKRNKTYAVVYAYTDPVTGESRQKWESAGNLNAAKKRKAEIENGIYNGTLCTPTRQKVSELMHDFVTIYGQDRWGRSVYDSNTALISNYINPVIGCMDVQNINARAADNYIRTLQNMAPISTKIRKARTEKIPPKV